MRCRGTVWADPTGKGRVASSEHIGVEWAHWPRVLLGSSLMQQTRLASQNEPMSDYTSPSSPSVTPVGQRRLHRSRQQRMVAGVAGGLAEYFDADPAAVRIGFVALSLLLGGVGGPILYLMAWAILPEE
jgi:phage shock protein PspC (stress-responsive transcriptional regulator)